MYNIVSNDVIFAIIHYLSKMMKIVPEFEKIFTIYFVYYKYILRKKIYQIIFVKFIDYSGKILYNTTRNK